MKTPKSHCKQGHPFSGDNLYLSPAGRRACRACMAAAHVRRKAKPAGSPTKPRGMPFDYYVRKAGKFDCWEWIGGPRSGYGLYRSRRAHRVAYELANGPILGGLHVLHSCDNRRCVNPAHLRLGTNEENMADMYARGRGRVQAKLNWDAVREIRRRPDISQVEFARRFGVSNWTIKEVRKGRAWVEAEE